MTTTAPSQADDALAKRNVIVLVIAQAFLGAQMPINFVLGGLSGQMLATDKCLATLPISLIVLGSMFTAPVMSNFMQTNGRRAGFLLGATAGALGAATCAFALWIGSFPLFLVGAFITGIYMSANGPQLVNLTEGSTAVPFMGGYMACVVLNVIGMLVFFALNIPKPPQVEKGDPQGRSRKDLLKSPVIAVSIICAMVSYGLMNLVMTSTPLAVVGCGYATSDASNIVMAHVLAMFVPSFFTGHIIAKFGAHRVIATGLAILGGAGLVALAGVELGNFYVALVLLGVGWNFGFIGATALLSTGHTVQERARVQGMNDFVSRAGRWSILRSSRRSFWLGWRWFG